MSKQSDWRVVRVTCVTNGEVADSCATHLTDSMVAATMAAVAALVTTKAMAATATTATAMRARYSRLTVQAGPVGVTILRKSPPAGFSHKIWVIQDIILQEDGGYKGPPNQ